MEASIGDERRRSDDAVARAPGQRDTREHRVRRADRRKQAGSGCIEVVSVMEAACVVGDALGGVRSHPERSGLVMRRPETVGTESLDDLHRLAVGDEIGDVRHGGLHG